LFHGSGGIRSAGGAAVAQGGAADSRMPVGRTAALVARSSAFLWWRPLEVLGPWPARQLRRPLEMMACWAPRLCNDWLCPLTPPISTETGRIELFSSHRALEPVLGNNRMTVSSDRTHLPGSWRRSPHGSSAGASAGVSRQNLLAASVLLPCSLCRSSRSATL
jgi:hypothetical protein